MRKSRLLAAVLVVVLLVGAGILLLSSGHHTSASRPEPKPSATSRLLQQITDRVASTKSLSGPVWPGLAADCYRCNAGLGVASALLATTSGAPRNELRAEATFDQVIREHQTPSGAFDADAGSGKPDEINTMFMSTQLGTALLLLADQLTPDTAKRWTTALTRAVGYLNAPDQVRWYANGNIQVGRALAFAAAWKVTGEDRYQNDYAREWQFALHPTQPRWAGWGFVETTKATRSDGSDGAGYFTEASASRAPGYDADYTQLQSDQLSRLYLITRDSQVLRVLNEVTNQLELRLQPLNLRLDTSGGSRHPGAGQWRYYLSPAPSILAADGRSGFSALEARQLPAQAKYYADPQSLTEPGNVYAIGNVLVTQACVEGDIDIS